MDELNAGYEQVMIEQQLEEIDADYIIEKINNQIDNVFEDTVKKNFLKDFIERCMLEVTYLYIN